MYDIITFSLSSLIIDTLSIMWWKDKKKYDKGEKKCFYLFIYRGNKKEKEITCIILWEDFVYKLWSISKIISKAILLIIA